MTRDEGERLQCMQQRVEQWGNGIRRILVHAPPSYGRLLWHLRLWSRTHTNPDRDFMNSRNRAACETVGYRCRSCSKSPATASLQGSAAAMLIRRLLCQLCSHVSCNIFLGEITIGRSV